MVQTIATKTLGDLQVHIKRIFGDESGVQITNADITSWANLACIEICTHNKVLQSSATTPTVPGQKDYDIGTIAGDIVSIEDVEWGLTVLEPSDASTIKKLLQTYQSDIGDPVYWYTWGNILKLWPVPNTVQTLTVSYVSYPVAVSGSADKLPLPDVYYENITTFVLSKAYELDEDPFQSQSSRKLFEEKLNEKSGIGGTSAYGTFPVTRDDYEGGYYGSIEQELW